MNNINDNNNIIEKEIIETDEDFLEDLRLEQQEQM